MPLLECANADPKILSSDDGRPRIRRRHAATDLEFPQQPRPDQVIKKHQADYVVLQDQGTQAKPAKAGKQYANRLFCGSGSTA
ncbi:MAG: hypothetical protein ACI85K_002842 [Hyphomicrobiaceae bacterium]|jgi:hypothetical protein